MKSIIEGSNAMNFDIVCLSFGKDKERGLKVIQGASKYSQFNEEIEIKAEKSALRDNDTLLEESGKVTKFRNGAFKELKQNKNPNIFEREIR